MEKHAVSKLIGAPPGYVGFDEVWGSVRGEGFHPTPMLSPANPRSAVHVFVEGEQGKACTSPLAFPPSLVCPPLMPLTPTHLSSPFLRTTIMHREGS